MDDVVTRSLQAVATGDPLASEQLLPLVYQELRKLAAVKLADEPPGQTIVCRLVRRRSRRSHAIIPCDGLPHMSPEQTIPGNRDIDTRSDIYSLGVLLYELLAGNPPFKDEDGGLVVLEVLRMVREKETPRPSEKLCNAETLPSLGESRGTEVSTLTGLLRQELDWITVRALEKDRCRRYETAQGLADVQRYLAGDPVQAHPPSHIDRLRKFVRRHRGPVLATSLLLFALLARVAGTT